HRACISRCCEGVRSFIRTGSKYYRNVEIFLDTDRGGIAQRRKYMPDLRRRIRDKTDGAGGGSRTHTALRPTDFESAASAIPPLRHGACKSILSRDFAQ